MDAVQEIRLMSIMAHQDDFEFTDGGNLMARIHINHYNTAMACKNPGVSIDCSSIHPPTVEQFKEVLENG